MAKVTWEVTLTTPLEHNGEVITKIGFRDMNGDDIAMGKIDADLLDKAAGGNLGFKDTILFARSIASNLSCRPKLGNNGGKLTIPDYTQIISAWSEHFAAQMEALTIDVQREASDDSLPPQLVSSPLEE